MRNMQIKIFTLPVISDDKDTEELNHFLRAHKIIDVRRELVQTRDNSYWSFCVTYMPDSRVTAEVEKAIQSNRQGRIDYKEVLDSDAFERFARMRRLRKQIAEEEAIPAYAVFTDAELSEMAKLEVLDIANMQKIPGVDLTA